MNTNNPSDKDLEYKLPEEQFGEETDAEFQEEGASPTPPNKRGLFKKLPKKKILIGIAVAVMIALVYQFLSRQEEKALQPAEARVQTEKAAPVKAVLVAVKTAPAVANHEVQNQVESLLKEQQATGELQSKELQTEVEGVKSSVEELQNSLLTLAGSVESISNQVQSLKSAPAPLVQIPVMVGGVKQMVTPRPVYYLKAIAPGREAIRTSAGEVVSIKVDRAWLTTPNGESLSVKVGDQLRGYGCVTTVNADEGWVSFTSGLVIRYAPKDT
jgi:intracellular multiplication protein IcmG